MMGDQMMKDSLKHPPWMLRVLTSPRELRRRRRNEDVGTERDGESRI